MSDNEEIDNFSDEEIDNFGSNFLVFISLYDLRRKAKWNKKTISLSEKVSLFVIF